jgi:hypothetical protein
MKPFSSYILSIVLIILVCGFIGCGIGAMVGGREEASAFTGYGSAGGLVLGLLYYFSNRNK